MKTSKQPLTHSKPVEWFESAEKGNILYELNRLRCKELAKGPPGDLKGHAARVSRLTTILEERQYREQVALCVAHLLDRADEVTKRRVAPLLSQLPLKTLSAANPYAGNASDDCHTFS